MPIEFNEISEKANGGSEIQARLLQAALPESLLAPFQIILSRVRELKEDKIKILWCHDLPGDPESEHLKNGGWRKFHKIVFVSHFQQQAYLNHYQIPWSKTVVLQNAINPIENVEKNNDIIRFVYNTTPHRGLRLLVPVFAEMAKDHSDIILDVYSSFGVYGWPERDEEYADIWTAIEKEPSITSHGAVSNQDVMAAMARSHVFVYPSIWPETSCEIAGTKILTKNGIKNIEDIAVDDHVMSHTGKFRKVTETFSRRYNGKLMGIKSRGNFRKSYFTPEHELYVADKNVNKSWKRIDSIDTTIDHTLRPKTQFGYRESILISDYIDMNRYVTDDGIINLKIKNNTNNKSLHDRQTLSVDFAHIIGLFAGDGSASWTKKGTPTPVSFSYHRKNKTRNIEKVLSFFGTDVKENILSENELQHVIHHSIWSRFFHAVVGTGKDKRIPSFIWDASKEIQQAFIDGYFAADGCLKKGEGTDKHVLSTISEHLAYGLCQLLTGMGHFASLTYESKKNAYTISWRENAEKIYYIEDDEYIGTKIEEITSMDFSGMVYNFEVDEDHSYVTENIIAHNCRALMEAMSAGCLCIHPSFAALPETAANWTHMYAFDENHGQHKAILRGMLESAYTICKNHPDEIAVRLKGQKSYADLFYSMELRKIQWIEFLTAMKDLDPKLPTDSGKDMLVFRT